MRRIPSLSHMATLNTHAYWRPVARWKKPIRGGCMVVFLFFSALWRTTVHRGIQAHRWNKNDDAEHVLLPWRTVVLGSACQLIFPNSVMQIVQDILDLNSPWLFRYGRRQQRRNEGSEICRDMRLEAQVIKWIVAWEDRSWVHKKSWWSGLVV